MVVAAALRRQWQRVLVQVRYGAAAVVAAEGITVTCLELLRAALVAHLTASLSAAAAPWEQMELRQPKALTERTVILRSVARVEAGAALRSQLPRTARKAETAALAAVVVAVVALE